jgi:hypothetical protein
MKHYNSAMTKFRFFQGLFGIGVWSFVTYKGASYIRKHFFDNAFTIIYYIVYLLLFVGICAFTLYWYKRMKNTIKKP